MKIDFKTSSVNYEIIGNGTIDIVFLHGWGGEINSFKFICKYLKFSYRALFVDFPPFGKSSEMTSIWTIFDYSELVLDIMKKENFNKPIIVGHSFGGRIACVLACGGYASKLVLTDSAGLKPRRSIIYKCKVFFNKKKSKRGIKVKGSKDYEVLSPIMKKTFVNIVNTFLEKYVIHINVPTLLFWGQKDKDTPLYMAKRFKKLIKGSQLVIIKKAGHFAYLQDINTFVSCINYFVENTTLAKASAI